MKKFDKIFPVVILSTLLFHLLLVNGRLLFWIINLENWDDTIENIFTGIFAFSYSAATIYVIAQKKIINVTIDISIKLLFAIFDGFAVWLWYNVNLNPDLKVKYAAIFFAAFTVLITLGVGLVRMKKTKQTSNFEKLSEENELLKNKIKELNSNIESFDKENYKLFQLGYLLYIKSRFNKNKTDENKLSIAKKFENIISKQFNNIDIDTLTVSKYKDISKQFF